MGLGRIKVESKVNNLIQWADHEHRHQKKKQWAINCEIHLEREKQKLFKQ